MKKFIKILLLGSIFFMSFIMGDSHLMNMSNSNLSHTETHCSNLGIDKKQKSHNVCDFVCALVFVHYNNSSNIFISYKNSFIFHSNFNSLQFNDILKPPIYI